MIDNNRVYLRELDPSEIDERFMSWFSDDDLMKYYTNSKKSITKDDILDYIKSGKESGTSYTYGIFDTTSSKCIGTIKIGPINQAHRISDLVVLIGDREYHGKGLASEAISLGNKIAFEKHNIRKLFGGMYETNISSIKAYTRAGWIVEGKLKDHYLVDGKPIDRILVACFNPNTSEEQK